MSPSRLPSCGVDPIRPATPETRTVSSSDSRWDCTKSTATGALRTNITRSPPKTDSSQSAHADRIAEPAGLTRRDVHPTGFVRKLAVEIDRAGEAAPWLDAEEWRAARLRPDAELAEAVPRDLNRRTFVGGI